eukprot:Gregarina_sp_Poly_1__10385@NODE_744_length_6481_cov_177_190833_g555_i0_p6_GENE_NODE_744_length_6481_cov_177_190833_g555_i0NODE_744_length_6481_cov_177_190833_g555_i0_p6_ORF_typecomplete_len164_score12_86_NODE_744_length_6481_cov_177_190833_g555_i026273118
MRGFAVAYMDRSKTRRGTVGLQKRSPAAKGETQSAQTTSKLFAVAPTQQARTNASALKATIHPLPNFDSKSTIIVEGFPQRTPVSKCVDLLSLVGPVISATELTIPSPDAVFLVTFATQEAAAQAAATPVQINVQGRAKTLAIRIADEPPTLMGNILGMIGLG